MHNPPKHGPERAEAPDNAPKPIRHNLMKIQLSLVIP